jgi:uncharacterized protein (TIGR02246 family)
MIARRTLLTLLVAWVFALPLAQAQRATLADGLMAAVLRTDETRIYAMRAGDTGALDDLLTPDCLYVHSNGTLQTKTEFLRSLRSGALRYAAIRYVTPPQVRLYGSTTAVVTGTTQLEVITADGNTLKPTVRVTALYVVQNDRWQLASYQSTTAAK